MSGDAYRFDENAVAGIGAAIGEVRKSLVKQLDDRVAAISADFAKRVEAISGAHDLLAAGLAEQGNERKAASEREAALRSEHVQKVDALRGELVAAQGEVKALTEQAVKELRDDLSKHATQVTESMRAIEREASERETALRSSHEKYIEALSKDVRAVQDQARTDFEQKAQALHDDLRKQLETLTTDTLRTLALDAANTQREALDRANAASDRHARAVDELTKRTDDLVKRTAAIKDGEPGVKGDTGDRGPKGSIDQLDVFKHGTLYEVGRVCVFDNRIWQATEATETVPGQSAKWALCMSGIAWRGLFEGTKNYLLNDMVRSSTGSTWIASDAIEAGGECPGPGWDLYQKQGKPGRPGDKGDIGPKGNKGDDAPEIVHAELSMESIKFALADGRIVVGSVDAQSLMNFVGDLVRATLAEQTKEKRK